MNSACRSIDLTTNVVAPVAVGQMLYFLSQIITAAILAAWNVVSFMIEILLLWEIYQENPNLSIKVVEHSKKDIAQGSLMNHFPLLIWVRTSTNYHIEHADTTVSNSCSGAELGTSTEEDLKGGMSESHWFSNDSISMGNSMGRKTIKALAYGVSISTVQISTKRFCNSDPKFCQFLTKRFRGAWNGWAIYFNHQIKFAGVGLACLYLTALGFDSITTSFAYSQGVPEYILGVLGGTGAIIGLLGSITFPFMVRRLGVLQTGWSYLSSNKIWLMSLLETFRYIRFRTRSDVLGSVCCFCLDTWIPFWSRGRDEVVHSRSIQWEERNQHAFWLSKWSRGNRIIYFNYITHGGHYCCKIRLTESKSNNCPFSSLQRF